MTISAYTIRTRLAKPDAQHQNWDIDFRAIMDMIDEIEGYSSVDVSGSGVALSTNNNATDQSRPRLVVAFGASGASRTITVPNVARHFFVLNTTNNVCVISAGAGTTITIASGDLWLVRTDGATNVIGYQIGGTSSGTGTLLRTSGPTITNPTINGLLALNGGQIQFPAAQSASVDPNTLDDYEEVSFNPSLTFSTTAGVTTYNNRFGYSTKIGRKVTVNWGMQIAGVTGTGNALIDGIPVAPVHNVVGTVGNGPFSNPLVAPVSGMYTWLENGQTQLHLLKGIGTDSLTHANFASAGMDIAGSLVYVV
jgi:hypothetical protein